MNTHHPRGVAHVLVLVVIVLIGLAILARLDINNTRADPQTPRAIASNPLTDF